MSVARYISIMNTLLETSTDPEQSEEDLDLYGESTEGQETQQEGEGSERQAEGDQPVSLADILTRAQLTEEDFHNVPLTLKANGEEITAPVKEILDGYRRDTDYRQKTQALANDRRVVEQQVQAFVQSKAQEIEKNKILISQLEQLVAGDMNSPEMTALLAQNPAQWQQYNARHQQGMQVLAQMRKQLDDQAEQVSAQQAQQMQAQLAQEQQLLFQAEPEWDQTRSQEVVQYLHNLGFTPQEVGSVVDHRLVIMADKARQFDAAKATQKARPAPKVKTLVPRRRATKSNGALEKLAQTGNLDDAALALERFV